MDDDHFRIGDNDRRRALESLTSLAASGHLTVDEFDERSAAAAIARTRGDIKDSSTTSPALISQPLMTRLMHQKKLQNQCP